MHEHDADLADLSQRLRGERPELSADGLGAVKRRVERRARRPSSGRASSALVAACLGVGVLVSGSGTALAVSGLASDGTAVQRQYPEAPAPAAGQQPGGGSPTVGGQETTGGSPTTTGESGVKGVTASGSNDASGNGSPSDGTGNNAVAGTSASSSAQPAGQLAATSGLNGRLPFTGFAAIPVLLLGAGFLVVGIVLRRRTRITP